MEREIEVGCCSSSDPKLNPCPICLGPVTDESYLDKCFHKFCYKCILQWMKVVASKHGVMTTSLKCPMCKTVNYSILHGHDGVSFHRHFANQDPKIREFFTKAHKYRLQAYYCETGTLVDTFNVLRYWKLQKYLQASKWSDQWIRREIQALTQEEDVEIIVHHILGVIDSFVRHAPKSPKSTFEAAQQNFKLVVSEAARPFLTTRTEQFVNELEMFLASGLNVDAYDKAYIKHLGWKVPGITEHQEEEPLVHSAVVPNLCFLDEDLDHGEKILGMADETEYGAFMEKFILEPQSSSQELPLSGLTFAVKDMQVFFTPTFDIDGYVTGFGNPDWARTHSAATSTAPTVLALLGAGATCVGKTVMDEMAYSINGENAHYGTPMNPCAKDRVPGGSSSGSAVAVGARIVDFSLGTDTGGSVRVPASYCGILGFRPSHGIISTEGLTPMAQSFDTVGWFARDPMIFKKVGKVLLGLPDASSLAPSKIIVAEDCFKLLSVTGHWLIDIIMKSAESLYGSRAIQHVSLGDYVEENVTSLKSFMSQNSGDLQHNIPSLAALSSAMRSLQRYEFKKNHGEWVTAVDPKLGPGLSERVWEAVRSTDENIDACHIVKTELTAALTALLEDNGILALPTVPGPPPKLQTEPSSLEIFRAKAFSLLSVAGVSGFCQVSIPLGVYEDLPVAISLMAKKGSDGLLLDVVDTMFSTLKEQFESATV
ncbi:OLC1v1000494C1 [Oldenlandia corymbosa var. corymbosa]|uniref:OLC1v1000494C1 n=1 Tax=Oldenlandia corymbosa var. corymbosa TaxID=529605 RepID=A0AAV1D5S6_OLDCO|nr:OLC1v1000494C1 [Oldenlandia corymbosa var. corymbosa]